MKLSFINLTRRAISQSFKSLMRNKWTNITTILALTLVFLLVHVTAAFTVFAHSVVSNLEEKIDIAVFFHEDASEEQAREFLGDLEDQKNSGVVKSYKYYSKIEALEDFEKKYPGRMVFLKRYNLDNPLVAMVEILPVEQQIDQLMTFLDDDKYAVIIDQEFLHKNQEESRRRIQNFVAISNFTKIAGSIIFLFFVFSASGLVFYAINSAARNHTKEIFIMRLVGARFSFIRSPFIIEGVVIATMAYLLSIGFAYLFFYMFFSSLKDLFSDKVLHIAFVGRANEVLHSFDSGIPWSGLFVSIFAFLGSFLAIEHYLRRHSIFIP